MCRTYPTLSRRASAPAPRGDRATGCPGSRGRTGRTPWTSASPATVFIATARRRSKPGSDAQLARDLGRELRDVRVDPPLDRDEALTQLLVLGGGDPQLHRDREHRAREVLPQQVEQGALTRVPGSGGQLRRPLAVVVDPLFGEALEGADDEVDAMREVVALGALRDARALGYAADRRARVADRDQALDRRVEQPAAGLGAALGLAAPAAGRGFRGGAQASRDLREPSLITTAPASEVVS